MSSVEERIARFENMSAADPENEMAHFSLGGAYAAAGRHADAADAYLRAIERKPDFSKAYQLAAEALVAAGQNDKAGPILTKGYAVAAEHGDMMPRNAIAELLRTLGMPVPEAKVQAAPVPEGTFLCHKTGRPGTKMDRAPFKGPIGAWIADNISKETFDDWIKQGTKVINELRLDLSRDQDAETYDRYMHEYLGLTEEDLEKLQSGQPSV